MQEVSGRVYVPSYWRAIAYAGLGDKDSALEWLEMAYQEHDVWLVWVKVEPRFDSLRPDPRFEELLRRMSFRV